MRVHAKLLRSTGDLDAVVPTAESFSYSLPPLPLHSMQPGVRMFEKANFGGSPFPEMQQPGSEGNGAAGPVVVPGVPTGRSNAAAFPALVPQMGPPGRGGLTKAQQSELEMARRRAQKAADGKRSNAELARRSKRKIVNDDDDDEAEEEGYLKEADIEAKLATVTDGKEQKRLKRLLRNRVSAQQARERKKTYVADLENRAKEQEQQIAQMDQRMKTLERENVMLRSIIKNMQGASSTRNEAAVPVMNFSQGL